MWPFDRRRKEQRRDFVTPFISFADVGETTTQAGVSITQSSATSLPAVYRCISLNCDVVSTIPVDVMEKQGDKRVKAKEPFWLRRPNEDQNWETFLSQAQASLEFDGNLYALKTSTKGGQLAALNVLNPTTVEPDKLADGNIIYKVQTASSVEIVPSSAVVHVMGFSLPGAIKGMSPISAMKEAIGLGLAAQQFGAQYFGTGATLSGVISVPGELEDDVVNRIREQFARKHGGISKSHAIGILTGGAEWKPLTVSPEESQFLETRRFTDIQIANAYGVPPEYVTEAEGAKGYVTGLYARQYMWMATGINPRLIRLERAFSELLPGTQYLKFNRNSFLAMDPHERSEFYNMALLGRYMTPNQILAKEDMDPYPGGDEYLWSVQWRDENAV
jgi:HK97 family phage portal protein